MKETALEKTDQDVVGRLVIMKMSGESGHLLRNSSFTVYKTLQRNGFAPVMLHIMGMTAHLSFALSWQFLVLPVMHLIPLHTLISEHEAQIRSRKDVLFLM